MITIALIGSRGIPAKYGGFETFVEEVSIGLVKYGYQIIVVGDKEQQEQNNELSEYKGVKLIYSKYSKSENPVFFYWDSLMMGMKVSEIIYSCGSGAGYFAYLPKIKGKKFITNPDGIGWERDKWSFVVKLFLMSMFYATAKFSEYIVCDSNGIKDVFEKKFKRKYDLDVIEYGADTNNCENDDDALLDVLKKYGLRSQKYHLVVSRLEPENNVDVIIDGYLLKKRKFPLIIVGNRKKTNYVKSIQEKADNNIVFLGGIYDKNELRLIRQHSFTYLHGHSVGGTNPSLLEAMACRNYCICHENVFNKEVVGENGSYFSDNKSLSDVLDFIESEKNGVVYHDKKEAVYKRITDYYNWDLIVRRYDKYFKNIEG